MYTHFSYPYFGAIHRNINAQRVEQLLRRNSNTPVTVICANDALAGTYTLLTGSKDAFNSKKITEYERLYTVGRKKPYILSSQTPYYQTQGGVNGLQALDLLLPRLNYDSNEEIV